MQKTELMRNLDPPKQAGPGSYGRECGWVFRRRGVGSKKQKAYVRVRACTRMVVAVVCVCVLCMYVCLASCILCRVCACTCRYTRIIITEDERVKSVVLDLHLQSSSKECRARSLGLVAYAL